VINLPRRINLPLRARRLFELSPGLLKSALIAFISSLLYSEDDLLIASLV
jgi:hypothetical protein